LALVRSGVPLWVGGPGMYRWAVSLGRVRLAGVMWEPGRRYRCGPPQVLPEWVLSSPAGVWWCGGVLCGGCGVGWVAPRGLGPEGGRSGMVGGGWGGGLGRGVCVGGVGVAGAGGVGRGAAGWGGRWCWRGEGVPLLGGGVGGVLSGPGGVGCGARRRTEVGWA